LQESWNGQFEEKPVKLSDYLRILYGGKWIIIISFLVVVAATAYFTFTTPPTYQAACSVIIDQQAGIENTLFGITPFGKQATQINNQVEILKSRALATKVVDSLLVSPLRDSLKLFYVEEPEGPINYKSLGIGRIRANLEVSPIRDTDIISLSMKAPTAWEAAFLANEVARGYKSVDTESGRGEIDRVVDFLSEQITKIEKDLKKSEEDLRKFQETSGVFALPEETQKIVDQVVQFESAYYTAAAELKTDSTKLDYLKSQLGGRRNTLEKDLAQIITPFIRELRHKIAQREVEYANFEINGFHHDHPNMKKLRDEIEALKKKLNSEISSIALTQIPVDDPLIPYQELLAKIIETETEIEANGARVKKLKEIVDQYSSRLESVPDKSLELARLERGRLLAENIYLMMKEKYEESRISRAGQLGKVGIVDSAIPPGSPISPKTRMNLMLGVLIGLGFGVGITFFLEYLDNSIRTVEDVERLKIPLLGSIPEIKPETTNGVWKPGILKGKPSKEKKKTEAGEVADQLITHLKPKSPISEAYRSLRTQIQYTRAETAPKTILVSSPGPGEGKSTAVANLAIAMSQMGSKTILVDADLRRPVVHNLFGLKRENGLSNYLVGKSDLDDIIKTTQIENLNIITTGILPPNPSEILSSKRMKQFIDELSQKYDYVFFDSPPIIAVTDALVLSPSLDGIVLVLRSEMTDKDAALRALELIENVNAKLLGSLLNDVSSSYMYGSYYYYYYYYYYYGSDDAKKKKKGSKHRKHRSKSSSIHA
jgi:polysaccharide chain length determinant protein (PEP-CTERM system associated)